MPVEIRERLEIRDLGMQPRQLGACCGWDSADGLVPERVWWSRPRLQGPPCTQAGTSALWTFSACHARTDLIQCIPELERAAMAAWRLYFGALWIGAFGSTLQ
jgi:hypothetical protein